MKILVTGGAGFIGSHVVDALVLAHHEVVVLDNLSTGKREQVNPAARLIEMDINHPKLDDLMAAERIDIIYHHAAQVSVRTSVIDPLADATVNILGSIHLLHTAARAGVRKIIYASSGGAVYGEPDQLPVAETSPARPLSPYGASKLAVEHYLHLYRQVHGLQFTVLRYPNVYGPRQGAFGEAGVIAIFARRMLVDQSVTINGDGEQLRDYLYVSDCVRANMMALETGDGEVYNLGWGRGTSVNDLYRKLSCLTGYDRQATYGASKAGETYRIYLDASKARSHLGWAPQVPLEEGLRLTVGSIKSGQGAIGALRLAETAPISHASFG